MTHQPIHERVKSLRLAAGLSLEQAASRIGCSKAHLWAFEQGDTRNPTLRMVSGIAQCFGLSVAEFMDGANKPRLASETLAAMMAVNNAVEAAYRRGYADGKAAERETQP